MLQRNGGGGGGGGFYCWVTKMSQQAISVKDVHRRQKLTTDFFKLFKLTILVVNISISRKKMLTVVSRRSFFKGLDNKIIGFVHI